MNEQPLAPDQAPQPQQPQAPQFQPQQQSPAPQPQQPQQPLPQQLQPGYAPGTPGAPGDPAVPSGSSKPRWLPITLIAGSVVAVGALIITAVLIWAPAGEPEAEAPPSSTSEPAPEKTPEPEPTPADESDDHLNYGPNDPEIDGTGPVADRLQALEDRYKQMYDDGSLWEHMPETKENTGAYLAFQFMLADMRSATRFGVGEATETQYAKRAKHLETLLLAQQPLGTSVNHKLQDGRTFSYDGETGAVGLE